MTSAPHPPLADLYDHAPCGLVSTSADGDVLHVNHTFLELTGLSSADVIGTTFASLLTEGSALFYETRCLPVLALEGEVREVALDVRRTDGTTLSAVVNSTMRVVDDGRESMVQTAVFDATQRRDYERDLLQARRAAEASEATARVLHRASTTFGASETEDALAVALAETARDAFDATSTSVRLLGSAGVHLVAGADPLEGPDPVTATGPAAEALRSGRVVTIGSVDEAQRVFPALVDPLLAARLEAMTVIAIPGEGAPLGLLTCYFGRRRTYDEPALELLADLARYAGDVLRRIRLQERLQHLATHDQLTGLANRALLQDRLRQALGSAARHQRPLAVLYVDIDGFKTINDRLGHATGDAVLQQVADRMHRMLRGSDTIARIGGDEFVVVCQDTDAESATLVAERLRNGIRNSSTDLRPGLALTASVGVVVHHPADGVGVGAHRLMQHADAAMYASKGRGGDESTVTEV